MKLPAIYFSQPIGDFALSVMSADQILEIAVINRRSYDVDSLSPVGGPQREASVKRVNEIARYSETPDSTFPTPILLALQEGSYEVGQTELSLTGTGKFASVVDGQHRLLGIEKSTFRRDFNLPVVFILDATEEQKALIFAVINGKQTPVPASVIYDLFNVIEGRHPTKTAHEVARAINSMEVSPFYRRLKMLGRKAPGSNETLSQGTFVTQLLKHISNDVERDYNIVRSGGKLTLREACIFSEYFISGKDDVILKIMLNLFSAVSEVFTEEWNHPTEYVLSKTTGYTGIMKALPEMIKLGRARGTLEKKFFTEIFHELAKTFSQRNLTFTSEFFSPNNTGESRLRDLIRDVCTHMSGRELTGGQTSSDLG